MSYSIQPIRNTSQTKMGGNHHQLITKLSPHAVYAFSHPSNHATHGQLPQSITAPRANPQYRIHRTRVHHLTIELATLLIIFTNKFTQSFHTNMKRFRNLSMLTFSWFAITFAPNPKRLSRHRVLTSEFYRRRLTEYTDVFHERDTSLEICVALIKNLFASHKK